MTIIVVFCDHVVKIKIFIHKYRSRYSVSVCRTDLMALDRSLDLFAHRFYVLVLRFYVLVIPVCGRL